ncbi:DegT/DnrJ/EryC1/StrS family aminotransferase [Modestobacter versicolor]|uniref:DegT/DnrJ/EryC1/StrS family aminotransferase n=1 Tax=Modestobacter versicolor TaxID=429133 RepID=UPI0034E0048D
MTPVPVPFLRPQLPSLEQVGAYYRLAEEARFFSNGGPCETLLRTRLSDYLGGVGCVPVTNATSGIMVAVRAAIDAAGTGDRRYVVMPSYTFVATAGSVRMLGFEPLFVDVEPGAWQLDADALDDVLAARAGEIAAVLGTHTFGLPPAAAVQRRWTAACREHGVPLVVDAAAGFGALDDEGTRTGRDVVAHVYSFHATKAFAIGEGGVVTTNDEDLLERIEALHHFGFSSGRVAEYAGVNAKLDELHSASALAVLDGYDEVLRRRRAIAAFYREHLEPHGFTFQAGSDGGTWQAGYLSAPDAATRSAVLAGAKEGRVGVTAYYDRPVHQHPAYADAPVHGDLPVTLALATRALALPMANDLSEAEQQRVVEVVLHSARLATVS